MQDMPLATFNTELVKHNNYLRYFPIPSDRESVESLPDDELVEIVDIEWQ